MFINSFFSRRWKQVFIVITLLLICAATLLSSKEMFKNHASYAFLLAKNRKGKPTTEEIEVLRIIDKIIRITSAKEGSDSPWKGFNLEKDPILITFDGDHFYLFFPPSPIIFQNLGNLITINETPTLFFDHDPWGVKKLQIHQNFPLAGHSAYVFRFEKSLEDPLLPFHTFIHERFHNYQQASFKNFEVPKEEYSDLFNLENLALMQVEEMLLSDGLRALHDAKLSPERKKIYWQDIVTMMKLRRELLKPSSVKWEDYQQRIEGLADYVATTTMFSIDTLSGVQPYYRLLNAFHRSKIDEEILENAVKSRHYAVGCLLAMALDGFEIPEWKERVANGETLFSLLEEHFPSNSEESLERIQHLKQTFGYQTWIEQANQAVEGYQQDLDEVLHDYQALEGVIVKLAVSGGEAMQTGGICLYSYYLPDGRTMTISDTSHAIAANMMWDFQSKSLPLLIRDPSGSFEFKLSPKTVIYLDQKPYYLSDLFQAGKLTSFNQIHWDTSSSTFQAQLSGKIIVESNYLSIQFNH